MERRGFLASLLGLFALKKFPAKVPTSVMQPGASEFIGYDTFDTFDTFGTEPLSGNWVYLDSHTLSIQSARENFASMDATAQRLADG